jgi:hypothetical protein
MRLYAARRAAITSTPQLTAPDFERLFPVALDYFY